MELTVFSRDVVPVLALVVASLGFVAICIQINLAIKAVVATNKSLEISAKTVSNTVKEIELAAHSLKQSAAWNNTLAAYQLFDFHKNVNDEIRLRDVLESSDVNLDKPLSEDDLITIMGHKEARQIAKSLLNDIELYCAAIQTGAVDSNLAFHMYQARFIRKYEVFSPFINELRKEYGIDEVFIEFQKTALEWIEIVKKDRYQKEISEIEKMASASRSSGLEKNDALKV